MAALRRDKRRHFSQDAGGACQMILQRGSFNDGQKLALQRPVMPFGPLAQAPDNPVRRVFDRD